MKIFITIPPSPSGGAPRGFQLLAAAWRKTLQNWRVTEERCGWIRTVLQQYPPAEIFLAEWFFLLNREPTLDRVHFHLTPEEWGRVCESTRYAIEWSGEPSDPEGGEGTFDLTEDETASVTVKRFSDGWVVTGDGRYHFLSVAWRAIDDISTLEIVNQWFSSQGGEQHDPLIQARGYFLPPGWKEVLLTLPYGDCFATSSKEFKQFLSRELGKEGA